MQLGQESEIVHRDGPVIPDYQPGTLGRDVVQALDGVVVPHLQITDPHLSSMSEDNHRYDVTMTTNEGPRIMI